MSIYGPTYEVPDQPRDNSFDDLKHDMDRQGWIGRSTTLPLPGGGNNPTGPGGSGQDKDYK